jgi:hypothetical protein
LTAPTGRYTVDKGEKVAVASYSLADPSPYCEGL